jgi:hypothetical protein
MSLTPPRHLRLAIFWAILGVLTTIAVLPYALAIMPGVLARIRVSLPVFVAAQSVQAGILILAASYVGLRLGAPVGLDSPFARALVYRLAPSTLRSRRTFTIAAACGLLAGAALLALDWLVFMPMQPESIRSLAYGIARWKGFLASFYGGIGEELFTRLFLMTLLVRIITWVIRPRRPLQPSIYWAALLLAAFGFAAGHLPAVSQLAPLTAPVVARIIVLNSLGGILFGFLYWQWGLEHAMVAHFACDLVLHVVGG